MSRKLFLPEPYKDQKIWQDLIDAIDEVWRDRIDDPQKLFPLLRDTHPYTVSRYGEEEKTGYFDSNDLYPFEKEEYLAVANMLGFKYSDDFFSREDYQLINSNWGHFLEERGTEKCVEFFSYCLSAIFDAEPLWTEDYVNFIPESTIDMNTDPIYKGGNFYPTTHVTLSYDFVRFSGYTLRQIRDFFYYIVPINIVLWVIEQVSDIPVDLKMAIGGVMHITYV